MCNWKNGIINSRGRYVQCFSTQEPVKISQNRLQQLQQAQIKTIIIRYHGQNQDIIYQTQTETLPTKNTPDKMQLISLAVP